MWTEDAGRYQIVMWRELGRDVGGKEVGDIGRGERIQAGKRGFRDRDAGQQREDRCIWSDADEGRMQEGRRKG